MKDLIALTAQSLSVWVDNGDTHKVKVKQGLSSPGSFETELGKKNERWHVIQGRVFGGPFVSKKSDVIASRSYLNINPSLLVVSLISYTTYSGPKKLQPNNNALKDTKIKVMTQLDEVILQHSYSCIIITLFVFCNISNTAIFEIDFWYMCM